MPRNASAWTISNKGWVETTAAPLAEDRILVTNLRHREALQRTRDALQTALDGLNAGLSGDLLAVDHKEALEQLGRITGAVTPDDLLDHIFGNFCIGK